MPPLIVAVVLGAGAYAGFAAARTLVEKSDAMQATAADAEGVAAVKDLGPLERDPATGIYRPAPRTGDQ